MTTFTKEQLATIAGWDGLMQPALGELAAFALSLMEERDKAMLGLLCETRRLSALYDGERLLRERESARLASRVTELEAEIVNHESWLTTQQAATYAAEAERDEARRELFEAEDAIREANRIMLAAENGEPRESIWKLLKSAKAWRLVFVAVRRALARKEGA